MDSRLAACFWEKIRHLVPSSTCSPSGSCLSTRKTEAGSNPWTVTGAALKVARCSPRSGDHHKQIHQEPAPEDEMMGSVIKTNHDHQNFHLCSYTGRPEGLPGTE